MKWQKDVLKAETQNLRPIFEQLLVIDKSLWNSTKLLQNA